MVCPGSIGLDSVAEVGETTRRSRSLNHQVGGIVNRLEWRRTHQIFGKRHSLKRGDVLESIS